MKYILKIYTFTLLVSVVSFSAQAQQCQPVKEVIMNFEVPSMGSYNLWDSAFGEKEWSESLVSGFLNTSGGAVVGGYRLGHAQKDMTLILSELDRRGRQRWFQKHEINGVEQLYKLLPVYNGFWAIGRKVVTQNGRDVDQAWIGMFDSEGNLNGEAVIAERGTNIVPTDIIQAHNSKQFLLTANLTKKEGDVARGSRIYFLNSKGRVVEKKSFLFGLENNIHGVTAVGQEKYAVVGRIRDTHNRWAGWIMLVDKEGGIEWQREYSRGAAASIDSVDVQKNGNIVVSGIARPAIKNGDRAGWVMSVAQAGGDVHWQRYYIGESNYVARQLIAHPDGLVSVLLGVSQKEEDKPAFALDAVQKDYAHARLLTLSPRGQIFSENTYFNGVSAEPFDMFLGRNNERLIIGRSKVGYTEPATEDNPKPVTEYSQDFWVVAGVSTDPYTDPCDSFISFLP